MGVKVILNPGPLVYHRLDTECLSWAEELRRQNIIDIDELPHQRLRLQNNCAVWRPAPCGVCLNFESAPAEAVT